MTFGIKELKKTRNGEEVHAEMQFPNGTRYFVIHDALKIY
jgi:hypothetical protein